MALVLLSLFVLVQSPRISASGLLKHGKACGTYHISNLGDPRHELFFINGQLVERYFFYKILRDYHKRNCFITEYVRNQYYGLDLTLGRRSLKTTAREGSSGLDYDKKSQNGMDKYAENSILKPKMLAMAVPAFFVLCCVLFCPCFQARKRDTGHAILTISSEATHNFSPSLLIGEGGFGKVYKAELPDGQVIAIKRARKEQFEALRTEFRSEVELLAKIDHRNLVKLLGCVEKGDERLIITEYVPNGTLREHLDGLKGKILDFNQRLEISIDIAHGLTYLHLYSEKQIIHRDVKSSNILLTESLRAKMADFGFARVGEDSDKTHVSTKVEGTVGYLGPEYMKTYQLTSKSDVYSFGILLLEILTGRRPVDLKRTPDERVTIRWAFWKYNEGKFKEMLDPLMNETIDKEITAKMFGLAIQCAAPKRADRPDMKAVGEQLWGIRMDYLRSETRE
ncbi:hypothetical protein Pfo_000551 [Paulownia fortunei]|nr:hypothetical protein Pfo_000551 [Paulownia fortunei]